MSGEYITKPCKNLSHAIKLVQTEQRKGIPRLTKLESAYLVERTDGVNLVPLADNAAQQDDLKRQIDDLNNKRRKLMMDLHKLRKLNKAAQVVKKHISPPASLGKP